jgi:cytochrome c oxidase assembly protein subunit 15
MSDMFLDRPEVLRRTALASLIANVVIVVTGGAVRLTGSGLGCSTWPRCTDESYVPTGAVGVHGAIEFSNRMITIVLAALALATLVSAVRQRPRSRRAVALAALVLAGIPAQAVVGGLSVLTDLNPWVVGLHFLASMAVIAAAYACWRATRTFHAAGDAPDWVRRLADALLAAAAVVIVVGVVVTGSGPNAGDESAKRTGLDLESIAQLHTDFVFLLLGLTIAGWFALRAYPTVRVAVGWLLAAELVQGVIGFVQYFTHVPRPLVGAHMLGSCLVWIAALAVWAATRARAAGEPTAVTAPTAAATAVR